ncbi:hypothetical protein DFQ27_002865 [Actinomortierella ambigua]|uniref:Sec1-like protein n=1 Tax=Actinomortierella ambigua TaxID=1343610 RepID=A0A9P6Q6B8_9FUNG|nr:hypothetical protein DFQ27_002865 [Actinomortierella ambigua]
MSSSTAPTGTAAAAAAAATPQPAGAHLGHTLLNIDSLRDIARKELVNVLDSVQGKKGLILDPNLSGPLSLITDFTLLKVGSVTVDHGVEKVYHLQPGPLETECRNLIYICRPQVNYMRYIAGTTELCENVLEKEGVFGDITKGEYQLDFIPLEDDLLSLETDTTFRELYLEHDTTSIYYAAKALMRLQRIYGLFPRILGKGDYSKSLCDMMLRMRREMAVDDPGMAQTMQLSQHIDSLIIIDRGVDLVTPLCTQLTYEGLIDELFHIKNSFVEVDASLAAPSAQAKGATSATSASAGAASTSATGGAAAGTAGKKKKVPLNGGDKLFSDLRDLNFSVVGGLLNKVAKRINADYEERHNARTVPQIRQFISKMGGLAAEHQSLRLHTSLAEEIMNYTMSDDFNRILEVQQNLVAGINTTKEPEYIEEMINKQAPLTQVLRLLCLYSLVNGGLKQKQFEFFKHEILETYGFEHIQTLENLRQLGMLTRQTTTKNTYSLVSKSLHLIVDEVNEMNPNDISYVYSGYAPLSVRLIQCVVQRGNDGSRGGGKAGAGGSGGSGGGGGSGGSGGSGSSKEGGLHGGWKGFEDVLRMLPGRTFDEVQRIDDGQPRSSKRMSGQPRISLVFFLGGCTYTEISATRFLASQESGQRDFVMCTSQILNGHSLLESVLQRAPLYMSSDKKK